MPGAIASANEAREARLNYVGAPCSKSTIQLERERNLQHYAPQSYMALKPGGVGWWMGEMV
jgi:hypothetical protein